VKRDDCTLSKTDLAEVRRHAERLLHEADASGRAFGRLSARGDRREIPQKTPRREPGGGLKLLSDRFRELSYERPSRRREISGGVLR
jgi:hypothetical protein